MIITNNLNLYKVSYRGTRSISDNGDSNRPKEPAKGESYIQQFDEAAENAAKASILMQKPNIGPMMHDFLRDDTHPAIPEGIVREAKNHLEHIKTAMPDIGERLNALLERCTLEQIISLPPEILSMMEQDPDSFIDQFKKYLIEQMADMQIDEFGPKTVVASKAVQGVIRDNISELRESLDGKNTNINRGNRYPYIMQALNELSENQ